jgi:hypothetical protein
LTGGSEAAHYIGREPLAERYLQNSVAQRGTHKTLLCATAGDSALNMHTNPINVTMMMLRS